VGRDWRVFHDNVFCDECDDREPLIRYHVVDARYGRHHRPDIAPDHDSASRLRCRHQAR
jgi:hypothetical protein